jgi:hypothetical protein
MSINKVGIDPKDTLRAIKTSKQVQWQHIQRSKRKNQYKYKLQHPQAMTHQLHYNLEWTLGIQAKLMVLHLPNTSLNSGASADKAIRSTSYQTGGQTLLHQDLPLAVN